MSWEEGPLARRTSKPSKPVVQVSEAELQRKHQRWIMGIQAIQVLGKTALICLCAWASVYSAFYLPIAVSHGESTVIEVSQNFVSSLQWNVTIAWGATAAASVWALGERRARIKERTTKDARIRELEQKIDPSVSSSGMTPAGKVSSKKGNP